MKKEDVPGINGYSDTTEGFINATIGLEFEKLHQDFLQFIPTQPCHLLDVGAGIGRDAAVLSKMGHYVTAVEPTNEFRSVGTKLFSDLDIEWIDDYLPKLELLNSRPEQFDFILVSGIWHHLDHEEQSHSLKRIVDLLSPNGILGLTLRRGPAGAGVHVFPTNGKQTVEEAEQYGLTTRLFRDNQPSLLPNKEEVRWTKLVFQKIKTFKDH